MKILRVNMSTLSASLEELPEAMRAVGGRGLSAKILNSEVPATADPLGPEAKLVVACGPVAGTLAPSCGRTSVGAKSPLTLGIKEANAGGPCGQKMDRLGIRAIVVEGVPSDESLRLLVVDKDGARLEPAEQYRGRKTYELAQELRSRHGNNAAVLCIGVAGERRSKSATVAFSDKDGHCSRHAARGGLGAVMGSKGLKAVVLDDSGAPPIAYADREAFRDAMKKWPEVIKSDKVLSGTSKFGTPGVIKALRGLGSMPSRNYSSESTDVTAITGQALDAMAKERGGRMDPCMPGCLVQCSVVFNDADGNYVTSSYEYETIALMGTNLGIGDPDAVARFDRICDELGIDTIELGSAMGVAASAGKMQMGDVKGAMALLDEVEEGTPFGRTLAEGVVATCKALGVDRVPAFKGQAIPAHDPRVTKPTGVTYHTSPMGADHTAGVSYEDPMNKEGQVERSLKAQIFNAVMDSLGYCILAAPTDRKALTVFLKDLVNARYGLKLGEEDLIRTGRETLRDELRFNEGTEFATSNLPDPAFVRTEPLAPTGSVFDVDPAEIAQIWTKLDSIAV